MSEEVKNADKPLRPSYDADRYDILPNFKFILRCEFVDVPLKSIRPFSKENEFEQIEEGGMNDFVHLRRKHVTKPHTLQVERYITDKFYDPIPNGVAFILPMMLFVGPNDGRTFDWAPQRTYYFFGAQVMNKEIGGFDAEKSGLLTETVTIAYNQMYCADTPDNKVAESWLFTEGNITNKYANNEGWMKLAQNNTRMKDIVETAKAETWHFDSALGYKGNGMLHQHDYKIKANDQEISTIEPKVTGATWKFDKTGKSYIGNGRINSEYEKVEEEGAKPTTSSTGAVTVSKTALEIHREKAEKNQWRFTKAGETMGNGVVHFDDISKYIEIKDTTPQGESDPVKRADAETWRFDGLKQSGNGKSRADHNPADIEKPLDTAISDLKPWPEEKYAEVFQEGTAKDTLVNEAASKVYPNELHATRREETSLSELTEKAKPWPASENRNRYPWESKESFLKS